MNSSQEPNQSLFNQASTSIQACIECMFACKHCASACLQEEHVHMMRECIKH
ncbi:four-helix bundle copper-binding protein, partial [Acinetobacter baumannii]|nr:four-helix bundle copper-binding protein [Acinetobacter baumannii]